MRARALLPPASPLRGRSSSAGSPSSRGEARDSSVHSTRERMERQFGQNPADASTRSRIVRMAQQQPGQPLDPVTRRTMEARFACDFSRVKIHADARAGETAAAFSALAVTQALNAYSRPDFYRRRVPEGNELLAPELSHIARAGSDGPLHPMPQPQDVWIVVNYGHLREIASGLEAGSEMTQGMLLAAVGSSGNAVSPHVHMGICVYESDPARFTRTPPIGFLEALDFFPFTRRAAAGAAPPSPNPTPAETAPR